MIDTQSLNLYQESTGNSGELPDDEYNIHCEAIGGPDWKLNYLSKSCEQRLMYGTCKTKTCDRFNVVPDEVNKSKMNSEGFCECMSCSKVKSHHARGLCKACYLSHGKAGTRDQFAKR